MLVKQHAAKAESRCTTLMELGPRIVRLLYKPDRSFGQYEQRSEPYALTLKLLQKEPSLDALAATCLLTREALARGDTAFALAAAECCWTIVLLLGMASPFLHRLDALAELLGEALLNHVVHEGGRVAVPTFGVCQYSRWLNWHCMWSEDRGYIGYDQVSWVTEQLAMLRGRRGLEYKYALSLPVRPEESLDQSSPRFEELIENAYIRHRALYYLVDLKWGKRDFLDDLLSFLFHPEYEWPSVDAPLRPKNVLPP